MREELKLSQNGQWSLEKNWKKPQIKAAEDWVMGGNREALDKLPPATGDLRNKMLHHLDGESKFRVNPQTNEKEYKAYRTAHVDDDSHKSIVTSWTTDPSFAKYWASNSRSPQKTLHAWIPENKIHSYLPYIQEKHDHEKNEGELLVSPHDVDVYKTQIHKYVKPKYHYDNTPHGNLQLTEEQSKAMHGKPHPTQKGWTWNHSSDGSGYRPPPNWKWEE